MTIKCFSELSKLKTFEQRYAYLKLKGAVGFRHFDLEDRILNQSFYHSTEWINVRDKVIVRDNGFDLGCEGYPIFSLVIVHHMNPITRNDLIHSNEEILDPEFLITTSTETHLAIHYGDKKLLPRLPITRKPGDTRLW